MTDTEENKVGYTNIMENKNEVENELTNAKQNKNKVHNKLTKDKKIKNGVGPEENDYADPGSNKKILHNISAVVVLPQPNLDYCTYNF